MLFGVAALLAPLGVGAAETALVPAGAVLRLVASPVGLPVAVLEAEAELAVLDRSGGWVRVAVGEATGWVDLGAPVFVEEVAEEGAADLVAAARRLLGGGARELRWGRFVVLTDRPDHPLLAIGERMAGDLPGIAARRHGHREPAPVAEEGLAPSSIAAPLAAPLGTVALFAREDDYRAFLATVTGDDAALLLAGHAADGVAALPLADRTARQAGALLLHELAHLVSHAALGAGLPPWLDEGLAGDLELVAIGDDGGLDPERWAEGATGYRGRRGRAGPLVALDRLLVDHARGRLETLPDLAALDRAALAASPRRGELYALAALWVRFLLDEPARADALRRTLAALADSSTAPADGGAALLAAALGADLATVERPFRHWLRDLARRF